MFASFLFNGMLFLSLAPVLSLLYLYFPDQDLYSHNAHGSSWIDSRRSHIAANKKTCVPCRNFFKNVWYCGFLLHDPVLTSTAGCILLAASGIPEDQSANQNDQSVSVLIPVLHAHPQTDILSPFALMLSC